ncbi:hypothetical protein [Staphylococcus nepalensis]|uniref:hypothetical protein n=2 Tax=Staphylococcus nepalensis TaxID=214473 RepID=UPI0024B74866|nr:hypothetical protein [Staphylococcus nepalensis]MDR5648823.1 hypothetical protein [Staphylococcus nepalensis]
MNRLDGKTVITIIGVISLMIFAFIFTVGYILSKVDPENKLEGYTIAISFIGIFATFGGAYLGAKIAGDNALKLKEKEINYERKKEYITDHQKMLSDLESKGLNAIKRDLKKWNNNLLNEEEQVYTCVFEIKEILKQIEKIYIEVEFTDKICENKFNEIQKNIEDIKEMNWIKEVGHWFDESGKKQINKNLKKNKYEIFRLIKKIGYSLDEIPKYDIYELEKGLRLN